MRHISSVPYIIFLIMIALYILRTYYAPMRSVSGPFFTLGAVALAYSPLHLPSEAGAHGTELVFGGFFSWSLTARRDRAAWLRVHVRAIERPALHLASAMAQPP